MKQKNFDNKVNSEDNMEIESQNRFTNECEDNNTLEKGIGRLSDEVWIKIFSFFGSQKTLSASKLACKRFFRLTSDKAILNSFDKQYDYSRIESSCQLKHPAGEGFLKITVSSDGKILAAISSTKMSIHIWNAQTFNLIDTITYKENSLCNFLAFSKDNKYLLICSKTVEVWDIEKKEIKCSFPLLKNHSGNIFSFDTLSNGRFIVNYIYFENDYDDYDTKTCLEIYDIEKKALVESFTKPRCYNSISVSPDESLLLGVHTKGVDIFNIKSKELTKNLAIDFLPCKFNNEAEKHSAENQIRARISRDNRYVICNALGSDFISTQIQIWNIESASYKSININAPSKDNIGLIFNISNNGEHLAVARPRLSLFTIWNIQTRECIQEHRIDDGFICDLSFVSLADQIVINNWNRITMVTFPIKNVSLLNQLHKPNLLLENEEQSLKSNKAII